MVKKIAIPLILAGAAWALLMVTVGVVAGCAVKGDGTFEGSVDPAAAPWNGTESRQAGG